MTGEASRARPGEGSVYRTTITSKGKTYEYWVAQMDVTEAGGRRVLIRGHAPASLGDAKAQQLAIKRRNAKLAKRLASPIAAPASAKGLKLETVMERWLEAYPPHKLAQSGKDKYRREFELHLLPWFDCAAAAITEADLRNHFYNVLPGQGRTPRSVYNAYAALRTCLLWAVKSDLLDESPLRRIEVKRPSSSVSEADDKWINKRVAMTKYMLEWLADPKRCGDELHENYPLILMMMLGLRRGELLGLEWSCFNNLERKGKASFVVKQQLHRSKGGGWFIHPETKNKKKRSIPVPELWRKALLEQKRKDYRASEEWASNLVFLRPPVEGATTSRWTDYNTYNRIWHETLSAYVNHRRKIKQPLTEEEKWRPHAQRHVAASLLFDAGVPLEVAQALLGHSDQAMTAYYTHLLRSKKTEATLALEAALGDTPRSKKPTGGKATSTDVPPAGTGSITLTEEQLHHLIEQVTAAQQATEDTQ